MRECGKNLDRNILGTSGKFAKKYDIMNVTIWVRNACSYCGDEKQKEKGVEMELRQRKLLQYSIVHFIVDFACIFFLYRYFARVDTTLSVYILYNFCAFALQMPVGLLADWWNHNVLVAAAGCFFIAVAYLMILVSGPSLNGGMVYGYAILIGLGNCLFHVGGGIEVLNQSGEKSSPLGIFVCPGAFGIYLGSILSYQSKISSVYIILILLISAMNMLIMQYHDKHSESQKSKKLIPCKRVFQSENCPIGFRYSKYKVRYLVLACLLLVVCLRSYIGGILKFQWKDTYWGAMMVCAVVFGKLAGGFLADMMGTKKASMLSLGAATVFFCFSNHPIEGVLAIFFFNMTMPITLWEAVRQLPQSKGFAFGLLTFALFLGYLPIDSRVTAFVQSPLGYGILTAISLLFLWLALYTNTKERK